MDAHVAKLREFRDKYLLTNAPGRAFVRAYSAVSPPIAAVIAKHAALRAATRVALAPVVYAVGAPLRAGLLCIAFLAAAILVRRRIYR